MYVAETNIKFFVCIIKQHTIKARGHAVAQLVEPTTSQKVTGSISDGVNGIFHST
jgi:hypothetical protein